MAGRDFCVPLPPHTHTHKKYNLKWKVSLLGCRVRRYRERGLGMQTFRQQEDQGEQMWTSASQLQLWF